MLGVIEAPTVLGTLGTLDTANARRSALGDRLHELHLVLELSLAGFAALGAQKTT